MTRPLCAECDTPMTRREVSPPEESAYDYDVVVWFCKYHPPFEDVEP